MYISMVLPTINRPERTLFLAGLLVKQDRIHFYELRKKNGRYGKGSLWFFRQRIPQNSYSVVSGGSYE